ncbi:hypothetical protein BCR42DRAFT_425485 [Absidia repens]|uniref:Uncharacterized protein n=1 Tax=Absidia repens TaxID=90262 RepID=A0A1X2I392_9FUNG|nr:hypothetical protein BCR42DRAFT_425485 [Absidia repens]
MGMTTITVLLLVSVSILTDSINARSRYYFISLGFYVVDHLDFVRAFDNTFNFFHYRVMLVFDSNEEINIIFFICNAGIMIVVWFRGIFDLDSFDSIDSCMLLNRNGDVCTVDVVRSTSSRGGRSTLTKNRCRESPLNQGVVEWLLLGRYEMSGTVTL